MEVVLHHKPTGLVMVMERAHSRPMVVRVLSGSAAAEAGLQAGDQRRCTLLLSGFLEIT